MYQDYTKYDLNRKELTSLNNELLFKAFSCSPCPMAISEFTSGKYLFVNDSFVELLGYRAEEVIGRKSVELNIWANPNDRKIATKLLLEEGYLRNFESFIVTKTGQLRKGVFSAELIKLSTDQKYIISLFYDLTELKEEEKRLTSEEQLAVIYNDSPVYICLQRFKDGSYVNVNNYFLQSMGYRKEEVIGKDPVALGLVEKSDFIEVKRVLEEYRRLSNLNVYFRTKSGEVREGLASVEIINVNDEPHVLKIVNDITELRKLEREIYHADRLNIIGEMAAAINHEIRNPMTAIRGFLQLIKQKEQCKEFSNYFNTMIDELDRINLIVSESLTIARKNSNKLALQNLNSIIYALYPLIQANAMQYNMNINIEMEEIPDLYLDSQAIRQLILNLCRNGLEAMQAGGVLRIKTFIQGSSVTLAVEDQGQGISPEVMNKLGKAFYTTKENGTGLGLAICNRIASFHRAEIAIETSPSGTTFYVHFRKPCLNKYY